MKNYLTIVFQNPDFSIFENSIDLDQLASDEASWSGSTLFSIKTHAYHSYWNAAYNN